VGRTAATGVTYRVFRLDPATSTYKLLDEPTR